jgi:DNA processing protein
MNGSDACDACLRRSALVAALAGRLDVEWRRREATARVLALPDEALLADSGSRAQRLYDGFEPAAARAAAERAGLAVVCRCAATYPERLRALPDPPAALHVLGRIEALADPDAVAIVGARNATSYGLDVSRALGRGVAAAGVPVVSGMALGVDAAAHQGALEGAGPPVAVLAAAAERPYPARNRRLHEEIARRGCVVSELPPGSSAYRWCFVARNRIVAALAEITVIVEAAERSGSLTTADFAADIGRTVAAVPGRVTNRTAAGTNGLLQAGAALVRSAADVLELLADATGRPVRIAPAATGREPPAVRPGAVAGREPPGVRPGAVAGREPPGVRPGAVPSPTGALPRAAPAATGATREPADLDPELRRLLAAVEDGRGTLGALARTPDEAKAILKGLSELEFRGLVRRTFGGRYERSA